MVWMILGLTVGGFVLILLDLMLIPGGLLVATGSLAILYAVFLNFQAYGVVSAAVHLALCLAAVPKLISTSFDRVALKTELKADDGFVGLEDRSRYIGMEGVAFTDLRPSGTVVVRVQDHEERLDCISEGGYVAKGTSVVIFEERGPGLVVRPLMQTSSPS